MRTRPERWFAALAACSLAPLVACNALLGNDGVSLWDGSNGDPQQAEVGVDSAASSDSSGGGADSKVGESSAEAAADASIPEAGPPEEASFADVVDTGPLPDAVDAPAPTDGPAEREASPSACTGVQIMCNGSCVDPTTDPNHCGGCNTACGSGLCGTTVAADMSSPPAGWTFNGTAAWYSSAPSARMTAANAASATGTVIYGHAIATDQFTASFQFRMGEGGGGRDDGMAFMIESAGPTAIGVGNGSFGMGGLGGYGVELDIYDNSQCGDTSDDHVGVDSLSACGGGLPTSLFASDLTGAIDLADTEWHTATVSLAASAISVSVDTKAFARNVALTGFASGTPYYYGFSGATGGVSPNGGYQTEVKAVTITFPTPRCL